MNSSLRKLLLLAAGGARLLSREPRAALLLLRMAGGVLTVSLLVRLLPLPRALGLMTPLRTRKAAADPLETQAEVARLLDLLLAADFWVFTPTCWKRAPVLHRHLALRGVETRIVFGVRKDGGDALSGHAWLEAGGRPLFEASPPDYKVTFSHPA